MNPWLKSMSVAPEVPIGGEVVTRGNDEAVSFLFDENHIQCHQFVNAYSQKFTGNCYLREILNAEATPVLKCIANSNISAKKSPQKT